MCVPAGLAGQFAQVNALGQLEAAGQATSGLEDVLAKVDSWRSTSGLLHFGQRTPSAFAPICCRRENLFSQSAH